MVTIPISNGNIKTKIIIQVIFNTNVTALGFIVPQENSIDFQKKNCYFFRCDIRCQLKIVVGK